MLLLSAIQAVTSAGQPEQAEQERGKSNMSIEDFIVREILNSQQRKSLDTTNTAHVPALNAIGAPNAGGLTGGSGPYNASVGSADTRVERNNQQRVGEKQELVGDDESGRPGNGTDNFVAEGASNAFSSVTSSSSTVSIAATSLPTATNTATTSRTPTPDGIVPRGTDVLCGRGRGVGSKPGNVFYNHLISLKRKAYRKLEKKDKQGYAAVVLREIEEKGGRFLYEENGKWKVLDERRILEKICTALRKDSKKKTKPCDNSNDTGIEGIIGNDFEDEEIGSGNDGAGDDVESFTEEANDKKCIQSSSGASAHHPTNVPSSLGPSQEPFDEVTSRLPAKKRQQNIPGSHAAKPFTTTTTVSVHTAAAPSSFTNTSWKLEASSSSASSSTNRIRPAEDQDMSPQDSKRLRLAKEAMAANSSSRMEAVACGTCLRSALHCVCDKTSTIQQAASCPQRSPLVQDGGAGTADLTAAPSAGRNGEPQSLGTTAATSSLSTSMSAALALLEAHRQAQQLQHSSTAAKSVLPEAAVAVLAEIERNRQCNAAAAAILAAAAGGLPQPSTFAAINVATGLLPSASIRSFGAPASTGDILRALLRSQQQSQVPMNLPGAMNSPLPAVALPNTGAASSSLSPSQQTQPVFMTKDQTTNTQNGDDSGTGEGRHSSMVIDTKSPRPAEPSSFRTIQSLGRTQLGEKERTKHGDDVIGNDVKYGDAEENIPAQLRQFRYDSNSGPGDEKANTEK